MKNLLHLSDLTANDVYDIFSLADELSCGKYPSALAGKTVVLFFPNSSIRTRVTFEKGIHQLGGQAILFPPDTLDKKEDIRDVCGYLNNWADLLVVRHRSIRLLEQMAEHSAVPVINAMTDTCHPCEILTDLYALSKLRADFATAHYLFVGHCGNIGLTWQEAASVMGFSLEQCCPEGYDIPGLTAHRDIACAVPGKDIVCTDSLPAAALDAFAPCRVTAAAMAHANAGALLNPCPPFFRGEEVSADAIASNHFVGYEFKKHLLTVQQAVMLYCLTR